jgi:hypothetical protein
LRRKFIMLVIFKPSGCTKANAEMTLKVEGLLHDHPEAITLKTKADISDRAADFIHILPEAGKGKEVTIAGHGCTHTLLANLFSLWDRGVVIKIKRQHFLLAGCDAQGTQTLIENFFGKSIWEEESMC